MLDRFLARITITGVIAALLVAALVVQTVRIEGFKIWPLSIKGMKAELADKTSLIRELERQSKDKQDGVREVIRQGKDRVVVVEREAKRVESAPLEGECRTPKLVLEADI